MYRPFFFLKKKKLKKKILSAPYRAILPNIAALLDPINFLASNGVLTDVRALCRNELHGAVVLIQSIF